jgi:large subunit ribosomal protein L18
MAINKNRVKNKVKARQSKSSARRHVLRVHCTNQHTYAVLYSYDEKRVIGQVSTLDKALAMLKVKSNKEAAFAVGQAFAKYAKELGIKELAFDRRGRIYWGRVAQVAVGARDGGIII